LLKLKERSKSLSIINPATLRFPKKKELKEFPFSDVAKENSHFSSSKKV